MATHTPSGLSVKHLYAPETVRIIVGPQKRTFVVPRVLICAKSDYFNKAFQQHFEEGRQGAITLVDVDEWVFECFVGWLYTERIFWEPINELDGIGPTPSPYSVAATDGAEGEHENDRQNPISWHYCYLINLYIFGDRYDTRSFRNVVVMAFQLKSLQVIPKQYPWPHDRNALKIFKELPESATLYRYMLDSYVFAITPDALGSNDGLLAFPGQTLAMMATKAMQLAHCKDCGKCQTGQACNEESHHDVKRSKADYYYDICAYHEHETEDERKSCKACWNVLNAEHDLRLERQ